MHKLKKPKRLKMNKKQLLFLNSLYDFGLEVLEGELKKRREGKP